MKRTKAEMDYYREALEMNADSFEEDEQEDVAAQPDGWALVEAENPVLRYYMMSRRARLLETPSEEMLREVMED